MNHLRIIFPNQHYHLTLFLQSATPRKYKRTPITLILTCRHLPEEHEILHLYLYLKFQFQSSKAKNLVKYLILEEEEIMVAKKKGWERVSLLKNKTE